MSVAANVTSQFTTSATSATNTAKPAIGNCSMVVNVVLFSSYSQ